MYLQKVGKDQLLKAYQALHFSVINWLAPTRLDHLERCQNRALRIITGQLKTTPIEALRIEAESRASQCKPNNKLPWPTRKPIVSQRIILAEHSLKNRAVTGSNDQAGALQPKP